MTIEYVVDEEASLIRTRLIGRVDADELRRHARTSAADPIAAACRFALVDCSELNEIAAGANAVRELAMARDPSSQRRRVAIVAPADASFGLARVFRGFARVEEGAGLEVFRDHEAALAWLLA